MRKFIAFNGSPRKTGNTSAMLQHFIDGAGSAGGETESINTHDVNIEDCTGCLRCNLIKRCSIDRDDWKTISPKILASDVVVFATPIYFHHVTASMKKLIDRFRSYNKVQITETGLIHTPWHHWKKEFVLLMCLGSSDPSDSRPVVELFEYIRSILGSENNLHVITATRLGFVKQIEKTESELSELYSKMELPLHLAKEDTLKNKETLKKCFDLGKQLAGKIA